MSHRLTETTSIIHAFCSGKMEEERQKGGKSKIEGRDKETKDIKKARKKERKKRERQKERGRK